MFGDWHFYIIQVLKEHLQKPAQSAGVVEYTDWIYAEE